MGHSLSVARLYYEQNQTDTLLKYLYIRAKTKNAIRPQEGLEFRALPPPDQQPDLERTLDKEVEMANILQLL